MNPLTRQKRIFLPSDLSRLFHIQKAILAILVTFLFSPSLAGAAFSSDQPLKGPGGKDYLYEDVSTASYGLGDQRYFLFEPDDPKPETAPLIIFMHGHKAVNPRAYGAWIEHIVKKGNILVYPQYQSRTTPFHKYLPNAVQAVLEAIDELEGGDHVRPDLDKCALVGHSLGGLLSANMAAVAEESGLPIPKAVMPVQPGLTHPLEDLTRISPDTLLLTVVGDQDTHVRDKIAREIFWGTPQIPFENKDFVILRSEKYKFSSLTADHFAPCCRHLFAGVIPLFRTDALDFFCFWKLFEALTDAAFYGENREYALGNTPQQRYMGIWEDGTPRKEMIITDNPELKPEGNGRGRGY
ncbi:MAG: alpha/beta hydrolase [bacterium]